MARDIPAGEELPKITSMVEAIRLLKEVYCVVMYDMSYRQTFQRVIEFLESCEISSGTDDGMDREEMVCGNCLNFDGKRCALGPERRTIDNPAAYWCGQGLWRRWNKTHQMMENYRWGCWKDEI